MATVNPGKLDVSQASDLVDLSIQNKWAKFPESEYMTYYRQLCNVRTGNMDETVKDTSISGGASFQRKSEGSVLVKDRPIQGYDKSITMTEFGLQLEVTKRMWIYGIKKNDLEGVVQTYKTMAMERRERDFEDRLDNGYSTSYTSEEGDTITTTGGDGVALFSASHTREDGGTNNNNTVYDGTTYNMDFEYDALKALEKTAASVKGLRGEEMSISPKTLIFKRGEAIAFRAREINGARGIPGGNENDAKAVGMYEIMELAYLDNAAYWFAVDKNFVNQKYGIQYIETQDIKLSEQFYDVDTENFKYNIDAIYEYVHNDYRGLFGSKGTNAS